MTRVLRSTMGLCLLILDMLRIWIFKVKSLGLWDIIDLISKDI